ncbi:outer membrane beta-barrel protein [Tamlana sp. 2_MG-2023]|uniref:outer membrane beta-barrel protein n=1 Tax=unclassified Tamlana TaxID=2614803 RepID=UPI0026E29C42|nr:MULTISPECIES: outer membrane beta-barrel protein [unclassified Tamlana]MDO6759602.1 outer membrane beta-barrel protein [Tamlana sp. 2_MG-2023]MDO6792171.1 outer membrane beta-barrel protein [Tamlana sp. 1_MG-2023]
MKKITLLILLVSLVPLHAAFAQSFEITPSYGTQFGAKLNYGYGYLQVENSGQIGITVGMEVRPNVVGELSYYRHSTQLNIKDIDYAPNKSRLSDLNMDWFFLGANHYFGSNDFVKPFLGGGLGVVFVTPENENRAIIGYDLDNSTRFSFLFKGGANFMLTEMIGLNVQGNLFIPIEYGGFYVGTGGAGVGTQSTIVLAGLSAGLVFKLGA